MFRVDGRQTGSYALDGGNLRVARHPTTIRKLCDIWKQPWLKEIVPSHQSALQLPEIPSATSVFATVPALFRKF